MKADCLTATPREADGCDGSGEAENMASSSPKCHRDYRELTEKIEDCPTIVVASDGVLAGAERESQGRLVQAAFDNLLRRIMNLPNPEAVALHRFADIENKSMRSARARPFLPPPCRRPPPHCAAPAERRSSFVPCGSPRRSAGPCACARERWRRLLPA